MVGTKITQIANVVLGLLPGKPSKELIDELLNLEYLLERCPRKKEKQIHAKRCTWQTTKALQQEKPKESCVAVSQAAVNL